VRVEFSDRGGVNIDDIKRYYAYLGEQSRLGMLYLDLFDLAWSVVDVDQIFVFPNQSKRSVQDACR
jgi:hypothetical protein